MKSITVKERIFDICIYLAMILLAVLTIYPFVNILAISLNDATDSVKGGIYVWPRIFTLLNYRTILKIPGLLTAARTSVLRTAVGTAMSVLCCSMLAFTISRKDYFARRFVTVVILLTMYFSGGMVPEYMLVRYLGLINSFWVYIFPTLIGAWNVIVLRSYIDSLPPSLQESAKIDGANDLVIFIRIIFPLCIPVIATISLFVAVFQWNSWFDTYLYASSNKELTTLQFEMMKLLLSTNTSINSKTLRSLNPDNPVIVTPESIRAAITIVATLPILIVYPFVQKYFIKGLTLGGIKS